MDVARHVANEKDVVIVADCNNVMYKVKGRAGDPVEDVLKELLEWARLGAIVKPICDGDTRHDSKQQHHKNKSNREKNRVEAIVAQQALVEISQKLSTEELTEDERATLI